MIAIISLILLYVCLLLYVQVFYLFWVQLITATWNPMSGRWNKSTMELLSLVFHEASCFFLLYLIGLNFLCLYLLFFILKISLTIIITSKIKKYLLG